MTTSGLDYSNRFFNCSLFFHPTNVLIYTDEDDCTAPVDLMRKDRKNNHRKTSDMKGCIKDT